MNEKEKLLSILNGRYSPPVDQLFKLTTELDVWGPWLNYTEQFGFTQEHIPQLIQMLEDEDIIWADYDTMPEISNAQIHAWRALAELPSPKAVSALINKWVNHGSEDDLIMEDIPQVLSEIGQAAFKPVAKILASKKHSERLLWSAAECIKKIGIKHDDLYDNAAKALGKKLASFRSNERAVNGFLVNCLIELGVEDEYMPLFERAFDSRMVDVGIRGDLEEIKVELGLLEKRITPLPEGATNWLQLDAMIVAELEREALERKPMGGKRPVRKKVKRLKKKKKR